MHKNTTTAVWGPTQQGSIIVSILIITTFLFTVVSGMIILANSNLTRAKSRIQLLEAQYAAESGADSAIANLNADSTASYAGTAGSEVTVLNSSQYKATFITSVAAGSSGNQRVITSTGKVYKHQNLSTPVVTRKIEVVTDRSSDTLTASGMMARNIIDLDTNATVYAKDLYLNGYLILNKNNSKMYAENITIAGKDTGVGNCSIEGSGSLNVPATFQSPGQTKVNITTAFNNCISPPGNISNASFNVAANQNTISKIQSTFIPWSQYMDSSYTNSYNGCADWTSGTSPRTIPSSGHTKQTHYPDSGSNVSTSCGTSGDLALGSATYNITSNVHIRANLCAASACSPTFYNPNSSPVYIFVEGSINFSSLTANTGGPIILLSYGSDPSSLSSICPYGGSMYLGNTGTTNAPKVYMVAMNGVCLDKTKYGANPGLGGISGKNIYISTNSGTPFPLGLDTSFQTNAVPINLAWHASRYRRL